MGEPIFVGGSEFYDSVIRLALQAYVMKVDGFMVDPEREET